jgi:hypothetical protein
VKEPHNPVPQRSLARNLAELEELIRSSPHLVTRGPATRRVRIRRDAVVVPTLRAANWPYLAENGARGCEMLAAVNAIVPRGFPAHQRADIGQDALVAILEGTAVDPKSAVKEATKRYSRLYPPKFGPESLDAPLKGGEGLTLYDVTARASEDGDDDE